MNKLINWIFYQIKLRQMIADSRYRKEFQKLTAQINKNVKSEIKKRCNHEHLRQVLPNSVYYECTHRGCNTMVDISDATMYDKKMFSEAQQKLINKITPNKRAQE